MKHFEKMTHFCTDDTCRREDNFNKLYAGMAGTFRALDVDKCIEYTFDQSKYSLLE